MTGAHACDPIGEATMGDGHWLAPRSAEEAEVEEILVPRVTITPSESAGLLGPDAPCPQAPDALATALSKVLSSAAIEFALLPSSRS
jgi:hypothetical protein